MGRVSGISYALPTVHGLGVFRMYPCPFVTYGYWLILWQERARRVGFVDLDLE